MTIKVIQADREAVARMIDPSRWAVLDGYLADTLRKYKGQHFGYDPEAFKDKASLAKADRILASHADPLRRALQQIASAVDADGDARDRMMRMSRIALAALSSGENKNGE